jgi:hypothetical protein
MKRHVVRGFVGFPQKSQIFTGDFSLVPGFNLQFSSPLTGEGEKRTHA